MPTSPHHTYPVSKATTKTSPASGSFGWHSSGTVSQITSRFGLRRYAVEHLVFSLYFYSFYLLYLSVTSSAASVALGALEMAGMAPSDAAIDRVVSTLMLLYLGSYLAVAVRVVFQNRWWLSVLKAGVLVWASVEILYLYRFVLFLVTFRST